MASSVAKNVIANQLGGIATPLIGLVMTPFYLTKIGLEGLGLVGLMALISGVLGIFVAGTSKSYQRDISHAQANCPAELRGIMKGGLAVFVFLGFLMGITVFAFCRARVEGIAHTSTISRPVLENCFWIIPVLLALGIVIGSLSATLISLRDQVWPNTAMLGTALATAVAAWISLTHWPRVDVFYLCQLGGAILLLAALACRCSALVKQHTEGVVSMGAGKIWRNKIRTSGRLSLVLILHEGLGVLITQIDRLLITDHFPLSSLGVYNLGANPCRLVGIITAPVTTATYPEMCRLACQDDSRQVLGEYLARITFVLVVLFGAGTILLAPAAGALLTIWLGAGRVPADAPACLILLSIAHFLLAIAGPAYNLTVAFGRIGYGVPKNIVALLILPVAGWWAIQIWGLPGAALVGILYALYCIGVCNWFCYTRHVKIDDGAKWLKGILAALPAAALPAWFITQLPVSGWSLILVAASTSLIYLCGFIGCFFGLNPKIWMRALDVQSAAAVSSPFLAPKSAPLV